MLFIANIYPLQAAYLWLPYTLHLLLIKMLFPQCRCKHEAEGGWAACPRSHGPKGGGCPRLLCAGWSARSEHAGAGQAQMHGLNLMTKRQINSHGGEVYRQLVCTLQKRQCHGRQRQKNSSSLKEIKKMHCKEMQCRFLDRKEHCY